MHLKKVGTLQIEPEATSQSTLFWTVQKLIVCSLIIFLFFVILGYTGPGLLGPKHITNSDKSLSVSYQPFARANAINRLELNVVDSHPIQIYFSAKYVNDMQIKQITPTPIQEEFKNNHIIFSFIGDQPDYQINFYFETQKMGKQQPTIGKIGAEEMTFTQWIYP